jgi:hypothetical protein
MKGEKLIRMLAAQPALASQMLNDVRRLSRTDMASLCVKAPAVLDNSEVREIVLDVLDAPAWVSVLYYAPTLARYGIRYVGDISPEEKDMLCRRHPETCGYLHMAT